MIWAREYQHFHNVFITLPIPILSLFLLIPSLLCENLQDFFFTFLNKYHQEYAVHRVPEAIYLLLIEYDGPHAL